MHKEDPLAEVQISFNVFGKTPSLPKKKKKGKYEATSLNWTCVNVSELLSTGLATV